MRGRNEVSASAAPGQACAAQALHKAAGPTFEPPMKSNDPKMVWERF